MSVSLTNSSGNSQQHWSSIKEAGTLIGLRFLWLVHKIFGRKAVSILLIPTVGYFLLFRPRERRYSREYLTRHYEYFPDQWTHKPNIFDVARHFKEFAETVVDKLLSWFVDINVDDFEVADLEHVKAQMADPRGQLIIGSHFGNLEYCRGFMHRYNEQVITILVHDKHSQNYNTLMQQLNSESRLNIFQVDEFDISTVLQIKDRIDNGEWVFIAGDRTPPSGQARTVEVEFLGAPVLLPIGPYMLAKGLACPVQLIFASFDYGQPNKPVKFSLTQFAERISLDRKKQNQQLQEYAQRYAQALQAQCEHSPFQWFNFYDYWARSV